MTAVEELNLDTQPRYRKHLAAIGFLGKIARDVFDVSLSDETLDNWRLANALIRDVDSVFDGDDISLQEQTLDGLKQIFGGSNNPADHNLFVTNETATDLALDLRHRLSNQQAKMFLRRGLQIVDLQAEMSQAQDPRKYAELVLLEGQLQCSMFLHIVNPLDKEQPNYEKFSRFFLTGSGLGNLLDSIIDIKIDHEQGQTIIQPTALNSLNMLVPISKEAKRILVDISPRHLGKFVMPAIEIFRDRQRTPDM